jgi:hypothetical protein
MRRNRSESEWSGLGIFDAYDPVVESMLLECEVEALRLVEAGKVLSGDPAGDSEGVGDSGGRGWREVSYVQYSARRRRAV